MTMLIELVRDHLVQQAADGPWDDDNHVKAYLRTCLDEGSIAWAIDDAKDHCDLTKEQQVLDEIVIFA